MRVESQQKSGRTIGRQNISMIQQEGGLLHNCPTVVRLITDTVKLDY
ncbi:hypothetical protein C942_02401 [Photobacterium marinum]|uniref:Uncharacterized protein n=1 Tax=Photobacterium marinum TaxID=1056511 RepID=L8J8Q4_9GAMM|nr:hypothetical protein C942_02401 [Photobacterium marinum]